MLLFVLSESNQPACQARLSGRQETSGQIKLAIVLCSVWPCVHRFFKLSKTCLPSSLVEQAGIGYRVSSNLRSFRCSNSYLTQSSFKLSVNQLLNINILYIINSLIFIKKMCTNVRLFRGVSDTLLPIPTNNNFPIFNNQGNVHHLGWIRNGGHGNGY